MLGKNSQKFISASIIEAEIETNGYKGGDSKKGGFVEFSLKDIAGTNWKTTVIQDYKTCELGNLQNIKIIFKGDSEISNFHKIIKQ